MTVRLMKSRLPNSRSKSDLTYYKYSFKRVQYKDDDEDNDITSFNVRPIPIEAYSKEDLIELLNRLLKDAQRKPAVDEEKLCHYLNIDYKSPEELLEDKYGKLLTLMQSDDVMTLGTINTGMIDFTIVSEVDEVIYGMYNLSKDIIIELKAARDNPRLREEDIVKIYDLFLEEFSLHYEQLIDML